MEKRKIMPAKLKYGEPTQMISIRVPQSRKEEIRELVRLQLSPWIEIKSDKDLPTKSGDYDCMIGERYERGCSFQYFSDGGYFTGNNGYTIEATHYKPILIPQPPKIK